MRCAALLISGAFVTAASSPAKDALADLQKDMPKPEELMKWVLDRVAAAPQVPAGTPKIMIVGDSWADVVAIGGNQSFFERKLTEHGCHISSLCIAIPGSTSGMWASSLGLKAVKAAVAAYKPDYVWGTLVGNDALDSMPDCAQTGKSEEECAAQLIGTAIPNVYKIVDAIHEGYPAARVTGFGYDTMFGGAGCRLITNDVFPQCYAKNRSVEPKGNRCFNTQFLKIQEGWNWIAGNRSFVDPVTIMGATQVAGGDTKASTDPTNRHIDMDAMGPAKYWPTYLACFHPGILPDTDDNGAMVVMEEFYKVYWSKQPACSAGTVVV